MSTQILVIAVALTTSRSELVQFHTERTTTIQEMHSLAAYNLNANFNNLFRNSGPVSWFELWANSDELNENEDRLFSDVGDTPDNVLVLFAQFPGTDALQVIQELATYQSHEYPLHHAAEEGNVAAIKVLLAKGANPNSSDMYLTSALHFAVVSGDVEAIEALISGGANPHAVDNCGYSTLHYAVMHAKPTCLQCMKTLMAHGADINVTAYGARGLLHEAAIAGNIAAIRFLVEKGLDVDIIDATTGTPLHNVVLRGNVLRDILSDSVKVLCELGADVNVVNGKGNTPLQEAAQSGFHSALEMLILELLLAHGADTSAIGDNGQSHLLTFYPNFHTRYSRMLV